MRCIEATRPSEKSGLLYRFWYDENGFPLRLKSGGPPIPNERAYVARLLTRGYRPLSIRFPDGTVREELR